MKFGRKSQQAPAEPESTGPADTGEPADAGEPTDAGGTGGAADAAPAAAAAGPYDVAEVDLENDPVERVDLGGLLISPSEGLELRLQVDESSGTVQSVLIASAEGAVELRAFAAPRNGDLWSDVRRQMAAETSRQGGTATEREGRHGPELACLMTVKTPEGGSATQPTRVAGVNGPRWFLRATYLGKPAVEPEAAGLWEDAVASVVVRRGQEAMAPGDPLPITLPPQARRIST
ncbi:DUF3710 domain-containing protein [Nocardioides donggukensis]|uniref:DUF3710 domain-containing protein n=1 Tax=Nocardioides donggukensis TaxID=2774019 RepID=A0A927PZR3_9ACTN|nr:DUF3710 domain-containing protein [Nocardioides donggukensis]MBD8869625.1 DUF3710 domain-containing protein [Nocardioides donggukensis]